MLWAREMTIILNITILNTLLAIVTGRHLHSEQSYAKKHVISDVSGDGRNGQNYLTEEQQVMMRLMFPLQQWIRTFVNEDDDDDNGSLLRYVICKFDFIHLNCKTLTTPIRDPDKEWKNTDSHEWSVGGRLLCQLCSLEETIAALEKCEARYCF